MFNSRAENVGKNSFRGGGRKGVVLLTICSSKHFSPYVFQMPGSTSLQHTNLFFFSQSFSIGIWQLKAKTVELECPQCPVISKAEWSLLLVWLELVKVWSEWAKRLWFPFLSGIHMRAFLWAVRQIGCHLRVKQKKLWNEQKRSKNGWKKVLTSFWVRSATKSWSKYTTQ